MPILRESDDEIVIGRDGPLNWLFKPTRIVFDRMNNVITWPRFFFFSNSCSVHDIKLVEVVSMYTEEDTAPFANHVYFVMDNDTTKKVTTEDSFTAVKSVAERLNEFVLQGKQPVEYTDVYVQRGSGGGI